MWFEAVTTKSEIMANKFDTKLFPRSTLTDMKHTWRTFIASQAQFSYLYVLNVFALRF